MAKTTANPVEVYLKRQRPEVVQVLGQVRRAIARAIPRTEEGISYGIPAFKLGTSPVIFFAGWKAHYSIYPASAPLVAAFSTELAPYAISKGTIRFPLDEKVPTALIGRLAKFLFAEATVRAAIRAQKKAKKTSQPTPSATAGKKPSRPRKSARPASAPKKAKKTRA